MVKLVIDNINYKKTKIKGSLINLDNLIKEKKILLVNNYDNLESNKFIKIIVDKKIENNHETNFKKFFKKSVITELENKYYKEKSCINLKTIYNNLETRIINKNGLIFRCKIINKGSVVYKSQKGFVLPEDEIKYLKTQDGENLIWFSDLLYPYNITRTNFFGLHSYILKKDFILFDRCSIKKDDGIFKLKTTKKEKKIIDILHFFGDIDNFIYKYLNFDMTGRKKNWEEIWLYTHVLDNLQYGIRCVEKDTKKSYHLTNYNQYQDIIFRLLKKHIKIDGFINCSRFNPLEKNGFFPEDEIAVPISEILNKNIVRNLNDPFDWTNWKLKNIKLPINSIFFHGNSYTFNIQTNPITLPRNNNFALIKYLEDSNNKFKKIEEKNLILTYNVYSFQNLDEFSKNIPNKDICKFINYYYKNLEICILQEFRKNKYFEDNIKFKHSITTNNGESGNIMKLCVLSKKKLDYEIVFYKDMRNLNRNSIIINYNNFKIACVHITISFRNQINKEEEKYLLRKDKDVSMQLEGIIEKDPDYIIGDFNFSPEDKKEINFMKKRNYILLNVPRENTTPYNRVDLLFKKDNIKSNNFIDFLPLDFSDHRPVFYKI